MTSAQRNQIDTYRRNGMKYAEISRRVNLPETTIKSYCYRHGWAKYNNYMDRQIRSILSADWASVFERQYTSFGKINAAYIIRKSFGSLADIA